MCDYLTFMAMPNPCAEVTDAFKSVFRHVAIIIHHREAIWGVCDRDLADDAWHFYIYGRVN